MGDLSPYQYSILHLPERDAQGLGFSETGVLLADDNSLQLYSAADGTFQAVQTWKLPKGYSQHCKKVGLNEQLDNILLNEDGKTHVFDKTRKKGKDYKTPNQDLMFADFLITIYKSNEKLQVYNSKAQEYLYDIEAYDASNPSLSVCIAPYHRLFVVVQQGSMSICDYDGLKKKVALSYVPASGFSKCCATKKYIYVLGEQLEGQPCTVHVHNTRTGKYVSSFDHNDLQLTPQERIIGIGCSDDQDCMLHVNVSLEDTVKVVTYKFGAMSKTRTDKSTREKDQGKTSVSSSAREDRPAKQTSTRSSPKQTKKGIKRKR